MDSLPAHRTNGECTNMIVNDMNGPRFAAQSACQQPPCKRSLHPKRLIDRIKSRIESKRWFFSLEFFPPRTANGAANLYQKLERLAQEKPLFCDVTWHPAGDPASLAKPTSSMVIGGTMVNYCGLETMLHVTCCTYRRDQVLEHLRCAKELGIRNILALRGDRPAKPGLKGKQTEVVANGTDSHEDLPYAADLVRLIRSEFGSYFCIGVAGYPNGHPEAASYEADLQNLKAKVDAGADFIITQLFFRVAHFQNFVADCERIGINVPIVPGLMPIQAYASLRHVVTLSKLDVPEEIQSAVEAVRDNDEAIWAYGVDLGTRTCLELLAGGACGVHFYTLNREAAVLAILGRLRAATHRGLLPSSKLSLPGHGDAEADVDTETDSNEKDRADTDSSRLPMSDLCTEVRSATPNSVCQDMDERRWLPWKQSGVQSRKLTETVRPIFWSTRPNSYLYRTSHWDEFPNGRWGDSSAASFGDLRNYHLFYLSPLNALNEEQLRKQLLAEPRTVEDLASVFCCYLTREPNVQGVRVDTLPWSDSCTSQGSALGRETELILNELVTLNRAIFLTINSQPAVNGVPSQDPVFGWGPPRGYIYQKAYLEFFCTRRRADILRSLLDGPQHVDPDGSLLLDSECQHFSLDVDGSVLINGRRSSEPVALTTDEMLDCRVNYHIRDACGETEWSNYANEQPAAVTWGVFPGREVIQPTVVDPAAFRIWTREAFDLWLTYWAALYSHESVSFRLLKRVHDSFCLVNVVDNDFQKPSCLFELLRVVAQIDDSLGPDTAVIVPHEQSECDNCC